MSSKGIGIAVYQSSSFYQGVLPAGGNPTQTAVVPCADFQYATAYFEVNNATVNTQVGIILLDQPFSGGGLHIRSVENPLYLDGNAFVGAPSYVTSILPNIKVFASGNSAVTDTQRYSHTFQLFGSYATSMYIANFAGESATPDVTASLVLFKAL